MTRIIGPLLPARSIDLTRVEGSTAAPKRVQFDGENPWAEARTMLRQWALTAPTDGSYHKVDFTVAYDTDTEYSGRFDLTAYNTDLPGHMRGHISFLVAHQEQFGGHVDVEALVEFSNRFEIGR